MIERRPYKERPYAPLVNDFLLRHQRCNLWAPPGFGKTVMVYTALDASYVLGFESRPTLVLGPLRVARDVWPDEALKWRHLRDITVSAVVGNPKQRREALAGDKMVYSTNYENLPWLIEHFGDKWPFGTVIADESTRIKSFRLNQGGMRAKALSKVAWTGVNRWVNLTGTPAPNGLQDLWGQNWFIDQGVRLGRTFSAFRARWFQTGFNGFGIHPLPHAQREIQDLLRDVSLTLDPKDWFDLKDPIVTQVKVQLPVLAMKMYKQFEKTMFTELQCGSKLEVFNAAALTNKCLQIANGCVYHEDGTRKAVHDVKLEALESLVDEIGTQVLVAYAFVSDRDRIVKKLGNRCAVISTKEGLHAFKSGQAQVGIAHPASMGHGIDGLQVYTNCLIRFGHDWNFENRAQFVERIGPVRQYQAGLDRAVLIYDIIAENTLDEIVLERHESKRSVQDLLLAAMRRLQ